MRFRTLLGVLGALTVSALVGPVRAEEPSTPQTDTYVVLVGVSDYADKAIKPRPHAEDDVKALYDLLTNKSYLGVAKDNIRLLLGGTDTKRPHQEATKANVLQALEWVAAKAKVNDLVIIAIAGEGGPLGEKSNRRCYMVKDTTFKERHKSAIAEGDVAERLAKLKSRRFVALLDVNFKGYTPDPKVVDPTLDIRAYSEWLGDDHSEEHNFLPGRVAFLATNGLSASLDLKELGLFTTAMLSGLKGAADKEGYEPDGAITAAELEKYLAQEVPALAKKFGKTAREQAQTHHVLGDRADPYAITANPAVMPKVKARLEKFKKLVDDKQVDEKVAAEGLTLLSRMPGLEAQQKLRKQYQKLADGEIKPDELVAERKKILAALELDSEAAKKFAEKVWEGVQLVKDDFVKKLTPGELVSHAVRGLYRQLNEKVPADLTDKLDNVKGLKDSELKELLAHARTRLGKREDLDGGKDVDIALRRMMGQLKDPHSTFIDQEQLERFKRGTEGRFIGIGVIVGVDPDTTMLRVSTPIRGGPAFRKGLQSGDIIVEIIREVDNEGKKLDKPEVISTRGLSTSDAVKKILGKEGTPVKLKIQRDKKEPFEVEISRGTVEMETVFGVKRKDDASWDFMLDPSTKIGYVRLSQFTKNSAADIKAAVKELADKGVKGMVFDLRFNPGGLLDQAYYICDLFIDDGLVVSIRPREGKERRLTGFTEESYLDFPMVVMVNGMSASGSEIVAACLQDHKRAVVMGERSFGKGTVQNVVPFAGGEMKLTTASFWRPNGKNLNKSSTQGRDEDEWGVSPDKGYALNLGRAERDELEEYQSQSEHILPKGKPFKFSNPDFKDRQLDMATAYLKGQIKLCDKLPKKGATD